MTDDIEAILNELKELESNTVTRTCFPSAASVYEKAKPGEEESETKNMSEKPVDPDRSEKALDYSRFEHLVDEDSENGETMRGTDKEIPPISIDLKEKIHNALSAYIG